MDFLSQYIPMLFAKTWVFFTTVKFPGTEMTISDIALGSMLIGISIVLLRNMFGVGMKSAINVASKSIRNPKISKERQKDEK